MRKKIILIDLDGVLNTYNGTFNENIIPPIKRGALDFVKQLSTNYTVKIFTTRNKHLVTEWVNKNNLKGYISDITNVKEPCFLLIDDRCINFNGNYKELERQIDEFKVWYK
jgi:hypothetical protein